MHKRYLTTGLVALAMAVSPACRKQETKAPEAGKETSAPVAEAPAAGQAGTAAPGVPAAPVEPPKPSITPEEIAGMIGMPAELPAACETLVMVDVGQLKRAAKDSPMFKEAKKLFGEETGEAEPAGVEEAGEPAEPANAAVAAEGEPAAAVPTEAGAEAAPVAVGGGEADIAEMLTLGKISLATGPGTGEQTLQLMKLVGLIQKSTMKQGLMDFAEEQGLLEIPEEEDMMGDPFGDLITKHFDELVVALEKLAPPLIHVAIEAPGKEADIKKTLAQWDADTAEMLPPFVKKAEMDIGGGTFRVFTVKAEDVISLEELKQGLEGQVPPEKVEKLHAALVKKSVSVGFGVRKDHLVVFITPDLAAMTYAASPAESLASRAEFEMLAECKGKNPFLVAMSSREVNAGLRESQDAGYLAEVLAEVLGKVTAMGDLSDVIALVSKAGNTMRELYRGNDTAFCSAGWLADDGIRIEALGGADSPSLDGKEPLAFAGALGSEDTVLTLNMRGDAAYGAKALDLLEDVAEISYELGNRYAASEAGKEAGMGEQFDLFRNKMLPHVTAGWQAMRGQVGGGLGQESALVMDLGAKMPKFPGLPEALAAKGKIPRVAVIYPVLDRAKVAAGWTAMEPALKGLLAALPVPEDQKINLPDASTSEKESLGLKTYAYPFTGFTNDDFLPSASISDKLFFLSSSKNLSEMLAAKLTDAKPGPDAPRGLVMDLKFGPMIKTSIEWLDLVKDNMETVFPDADKREEFLAEEPEMRKALDWFGGFEGLSLRRSPEGSRWRTSLHFRGKLK